MTECARVILCDPDGPGGLSTTGAAAGRVRDGDAPDADGDEGGDESRTAAATHEPRNPRQGGEDSRTAAITSDPRNPAPGQSRVAIGGGTARGDRAVVVSRAFGANRANATRSAVVVRLAAREVTA